MRLHVRALVARATRHIDLSVWVLPFVSLGVVAGMVRGIDVDAPAVICAAVCASDLGAATLAGLLVGTPVAALIHRPTTAAMAVTVAVCSFWYQEAAMRSSWTGPAGVAYGIVGLLVAIRPDRARAFSPPQMLAVPPRPSDLPSVRPRWWALALSTCGQGMRSLPIPVRRREPQQQSPVVQHGGLRDDREDPSLRRPACRPRLKPRPVT